eukprot:scaffold2028_cov353-Pavlova_lutheri.AAC.1
MTHPPSPLALPPLGRESSLPSLRRHSIPRSPVDDDAMVKFLKVSEGWAIRYAETRSQGRMET